MEIKIEEKLVPITTTREVTTKTFVFTEEEATVLRDAIGGSDISKLAENAARRGYNHSRLSQKEFEEKILTIYYDLDKFI